MDDARDLAAVVVDTARAMLERRRWRPLRSPERDATGTLWFVEDAPAADRALVVSPAIARAFCAASVETDPDPTRVVFDSLVQPPSSCGRAQIGKRRVDQLVAEADRRAVDRIVFVTDELATPAARADLRDGNRVEYFHASELVHDPMGVAAGMPTYRVVDADDAERLFRHWHATPRRFPVLDVNDPVCRVLGCDRGAVLEIVDPATGFVRYRVVGDKK